MATANDPVAPNLPPVDVLFKAYKSRRTIIPLLGAGISVESGYPHTGAIVNYLAKVRHSRKSVGSQGSSFEVDQSDLDLNPTRWPDPFDLNEELWNSNEINHQPDQMRAAIEAIFKDELKEEAFEIHERFQEVHKFLSRDALDEWKNHLQQTAQGVDGIDWKKILEMQRFGVSPPNWRSILRHVTAGRSEQVDGLFQMFNRGREPGNSHRFLAFLARELGWDLVLTTNFDDLIERAMRSEGLSPTIYDIWRGAELPNKLLVGGGLSVLKLHGGAYGLRVGESLDDPLGRDEREKLLSYMPGNPLILVLGFGGYDRRIIDLIDAHLQRSQKLPESETQLSVLWVHFEPTVPTKIEELKKKYPKLLQSGRTQDAGAFLIDFHTRITRSHPVGSGAYSAHFQRPLGLQARISDEVARTEAEPPEKLKPVHLFTGEPNRNETSKATPAEDRCPQDGSSIAMSIFLSNRTATHTPIWLDAGMFQTVEELVAEVIRQCRKHDPSLPSVVLALGGGGGGKSPSERAKATRRVLAALKRGCYVLAIDEIGLFGRPPTTHHGLPESSCQHVRAKVEELRDFLNELIAGAHQCGDSLLCLSVNDVVDRFHKVGGGGDKAKHSHFQEVHEIMQKFRWDLQDLALTDPSRIEPHPNDCVWPPRKLDPASEAGIARAKEETEIRAELGSEIVDDLDALIATFRRPRSLVALHKLTTEYFVKGNDSYGKTRPCPPEGESKKLDQWLAWLARSETLIPLEGALYWMGATVRDRLYHESSKLASGATIFKLMGSGDEVCRFHGVDPDNPVGEHADLYQIARQVARLTLQHKSIARYYYSELFLPSKDVTAFFEYLYHRISSIRYGTILAALIANQGLAIHDKLPQATESNRPDPVGQFLRDLLEKRNPPGRPETAIRERLEDIRALRGTLDRDRELLLSRVPSDTLLGWLDWIINHDLARFRLAYWSSKLNINKNINNPEVTENQNELEHEAKIDFNEDETSLENRNDEEVLLILRSLHAFRGKVLREKTDFGGCILARGLQLKTLVDHATPPEPGQVAAAGGPSDTKKSIEWIWGEYKRFFPEDLADRFDLQVDALGAVLDVGNCLKGLHYYPEAAEAIRKIEEELHRFKELKHLKAKHVELADPLRVRLFFRTADLILAGLDYWDIKNDGLEAEALMEHEHLRALGQCDGGLDLVRETNTQPAEYFVYRSYLRTQRGRALAIHKQFEVASWEFSQAMAGLDPRPGSSRNAMAVRTLYLGESLMFASDHHIMKHCNALLDESLGVVPRDTKQLKPRLLSSQGRLFANFAKFFERFDPGLSVEDQNQTRDLLRRVLMPWAHHLEKGDVERVRKGATISLALIEKVAPRRKEVVARVRQAVESLQPGAWDQDFSKACAANLGNVVDKALRRSLAYWAGDQLVALMVSKPKEDDKKEQQPSIRDIQKQARLILVRARDILVEAETLLTGGRRDIQFWFLLHRLRAQVCFEDLLMGLTLGPELASASLPESEEERAERRRFSLEFTHQARAGLRSLRDARDTILAGTNSEGQDPRPAGLNRLQSHILVACFCNEWFMHQMNRRKKISGFSADFEVGNFQEYWSILNRTEEPGETSATFVTHKAYLDLLLEELQSLGGGYSLKARALVESHLKLFGGPLEPVTRLLKEDDAAEGLG